MSIDRMIVKVEGASWRIIEVAARIPTTSPSSIPVDILAQVPGSSYSSIFTTTPSIAIGLLSASGGVIKDDRRILPIGTLVRLGDTDNNVDITTELHYRTHAVGQ